MEILKLNEQYEIEIDKAWIAMVPEFAALLKRDKGSSGDSEGRKKLRAKKELSYAFLIADFKSPLFEWDPEEAHEEALRYTGLEDKDIDALVKAATAEYKKIMIKGSRALKSIEAVYKGLNSIDEYYNNLDLKKTDKQGKLLHSPKEAIQNIKLIKEGYENLSKFKQSIEEELKKNTTIRGTASLGDKETSKRTTWKEGGQESPDTPTTVSWGTLANDVQVKQDGFTVVSTGEDEEQEEEETD